MGEATRLGRASCRQATPQGVEGTRARAPLRPHEGSQQTHVTSSLGGFSSVAHEGVSQSVCVFLFDRASNLIMIPFLDNKNMSWMRVYLIYSSLNKYNLQF